MAHSKKLIAEVYGKLVDMVGEEGAEMLMAQGPPGGWDQFATKVDVQTLAAEMAVGFAEADARTERLNAKVDTVDAKVGTVDAKVEAVDVKVEANAAALKMYTEAGFATLQAKIDVGFAEMTATRSRDVWAFTATVAVLLITVIIVIVVGT